MNSLNRGVAGVLTGLVCAGALFTGGQAFAAPAPAAAVSGQASVSGTLTGSITATLSGAIVVRTSDSALVTVKLNADTKIEGKLSLSVKVTVHTVKIDGELYASLIVIG